jgi:hypothetical protein
MPEKIESFSDLCLRHRLNCVRACIVADVPTLSLLITFDWHIRTYLHSVLLGIPIGAENAARAQRMLAELEEAWRVRAADGDAFDSLLRSAGERVAEPVSLFVPGLRGS